MAKRCPPYPYLALREAVLCVRALVDEYALRDLTITMLAVALHHSPRSSTLRRKISSLKQFGLLKNVVSNGQDMLRITYRARDTVSISFASSLAARREAALEPMIYKELYENHIANLSLLPTVDGIVHYLAVHRSEKYTAKVALIIAKGFTCTWGFARMDGITPGMLLDDGPAKEKPALSVLTESTVGTTEDLQEVSDRNIIEPPELRDEETERILIPTSVLLDDGEIEMVMIPRMPAKSFNAFKAQLNMLEEMIVITEEEKDE